jgi:hypothetical protein
MISNTFVKSTKNIVNLNIYKYITSSSIRLNFDNNNNNNNRNDSGYSRVFEDKKNIKFATNKDRNIDGIIRTNDNRDKQIDRQGNEYDHNNRNNSMNNNNNNSNNNEYYNKDNNNRNRSQFSNRNGRESINIARHREVRDNPIDREDRYDRNFRRPSIQDQNNNYNSNSYNRYKNKSNIEKKEPPYGLFDGDHLYGISPVLMALSSNQREISELLIQTGIIYIFIYIYERKSINYISIYICLSIYL